MPVALQDFGVGASVGVCGFSAWGLGFGGFEVGFGGLSGLRVQARLGALRAASCKLCWFVPGNSGILVADIVP